MTDKERLENIKRKFDLDLVGRIEDSKLISPQDLLYLIQQAERVQELEKELEEWQNEALRWIKLFEESQERLSKVEYVEELEKELDEWTNEALRLFKLLEEYQELNKRYREALKFYADESIYSARNKERAEITLDYGEKARKALEGE